MTQSVTVDDGAAVEVNFTLKNIALEIWSRENDFNLLDSLKGDQYVPIDDVPDMLKGVADRNPDFATYSLIGEDVLVTPLSLLTLTNTKSTKKADEKATIGGLKGEQPVGGEMLIRFIVHLTQGEVFIL